MNWFQINERILELEQKETLTDDEVKEWNKLVNSKLPGVLNRNEKDITKEKGKVRGEKTKN